MRGRAIAMSRILGTRSPRRLPAASYTIQPCSCSFRAQPPLLIHNSSMKYNIQERKYQTFYPQSLRFFDLHSPLQHCVRRAYTFSEEQILYAVLTCARHPVKHMPLRDFACLFRFRLANLLARMYFISRKALIRCLDTDAVHDRQTESILNQPMLSRVALANLSRLY